MVGYSAPDTAIYKYWERRFLHIAIHFLRNAFFKILHYVSELWILSKTLESS